MKINNFEFSSQDAYTRLPMHIIDNSMQSFKRHLSGFIGGFINGNIIDAFNRDISNQIRNIKYSTYSVMQRRRIWGALLTPTAGE